MNKTLHLIRKDLRLCRWWLLAWTMACAAHLGFRLYQLKAGDTAVTSGFFRHLETSDRWDWQVVRLLPLFIIPFFMHADPLVKRCAFWKALPVSRARLIAVKLAVVLCFFVVLPLACEITYFKSAGLSSILPHALGTWAWRYLPLVLVVTLACYVTPGMLWGLPVAAGLYVLFLVGVRRLPDVVDSYPASAENMKRGFPDLPEAPEGVRIRVDADSADLSSITSTSIDPATRKPVYQEWTGISIDVDVESLPDDVLIDHLACEFKQLDLGSTTMDVYAVASLEDTFRSVPEIPMDETMRPANQAGLVKLDEPVRVWSFKASADMSARSIPLDGAELSGFVTARLVKRVPVRRMDPENGDPWIRGLDRLHLDAAPEPAHRVLCFNSRYHQPLATDGHGNPAVAPSSLWPQGSVAWIRHKTRPYGWPLRGSAPVPYRDITRMRDLAVTRWNVGIDEVLSPVMAPLARLRFRDELSGPEHWEVEFVRYEPVGEFDLPFRVKVLRPQSLPVIERVAQEDEFTSFPKPYASYLDEIQLPAEPTPDEIRKAFAALTELCSGNWNGFHNVKWKVDGLLARIATEDPDLLFDALHRHIRADIREHEERGYDPFWNARTSFVHRDYDSGEEVWKPRAASVDGYWWHVRHALIATATEDRKELYLRHLSPRINLLPVMERFGWMEDALPVIQGIAMREPVPFEWRYELMEDARRNDSARSKQAMERQIRQGALEFYRVVDCFVTGALDGTRVANAAWDTTVERAVKISEVRDAFLLALKHGIESAPRDLLRIMGGEVLRDLGDDREQRLILLSMVQALSVHSDCPPDLAGATGWLAANAHELVWNPVSRRYERPGGTVHKPFYRTGERFGEWIDPMGVGTLGIESDSIRMDVRAIPTWAGEFVFGRNIPRLMKPAAGDFTAEVTVDLPALVTGTWSGSPHDIVLSAGLIMEAGRYHYMIVQKQFFGPEAQPRIEVLNNRPKKRDAVRFENDAWDPEKPVRLRLSRHGDWFFSSWRQGEGDWIESECFYNADWENEVRVGPFIASGLVKPAEALFTDFELRAGSEPPQQPLRGKFSTKNVVATPDGTRIEGWGVVRNPLANGVFRASGGGLQIRSAPGVGSWSNEWMISAPAVLREVDGGFSYEVTVGPAPMSGQSWSSAVALVCTPDKSMSYKIGNGVGKPGEPWLNQRRWTNGYPDGTFGVPIKIDHAKPLRIRFERGRHMLAVHVKPDGNEEWTLLGEIPTRGLPQKLEVGVAGVNAGPVDSVLEFHDPLLRTAGDSVSK